MFPLKDKPVDQNLLKTGEEETMRKAGLCLFMILLLTGCAQKPDWRDPYDRGLEYLEGKRYKDAIELFTQAAEAEAEHPEIYAARGDAHARSGETASHMTAAEADYEKAISLDGSFAEGYLGLADISIRRKDYDTALEILSDGMEKTNGSRKLSDKIVEINSGTIRDSQDQLRKLSSYDKEGNLVWYHEYYYDENGHKSYVSVYNGAGVQTDEIEVAYDGQGNLTDTFGYEEKDGSLYKITHTYDSDGQRVKTERYDHDGALENSKTYEHDEDGNLVKEEYYDSDNQLKACYIYEYDAEGKIEKHSLYGPEGELRSYWTFETNSEGKRSRDNFYDKDGKLQCYFVYEYDDNGELIEKREFIEE